MRGHHGAFHCWNQSQDLTPRGSTTRSFYLDLRTSRKGGEIALAAGFDTQDAEAVLGVVERDAVDQAG